MNPMMNAFGKVCRRSFIPGLTCLCVGLLGSCNYVAQSYTAFDSADTSGLWGLSAPVSTFADGAVIPEKYAAPSNISPPLSWKTFVSPVMEYVVIVQDIDAEGGPAANWIVYNLAADSPKLDENAAASGKLTQGKNSKGVVGYSGPDAGDAKPHHYTFQVFALFKPLGLEPGADAEAVVTAMKGKVAAKSRLFGYYPKVPK